MVGFLIIWSGEILLPKMHVGQGTTWEKENVPYEIGTFVTNGDKNYYSLELIVKNVPGVIFKIGQRFAERNINIVRFIHSDTEGDTTVIFIVGDFTKSKVSPEKLYEELKRDSEYILEIAFSNKAGNVYYPAHLFPITLDNNRAILFGLANIYGLIYDLRKNIGVDTANTLLYHLGYGVGEAVYKHHFKPRKYSPDNLEEVMNLIDAIMVSYGWGILKNYQFLGDKIFLEFEDLWECEAQKNMEDTYGSHYFRGILGGFFGSLFDTKADVEEVKCIARGDDVCRFEITLIE